MPTTRKKVIKTYKEDEGSDAPSGDDFEDSGSEASISGEIESSAESESAAESEDDDFKEPQSSRKRIRNAPPKSKEKFSKSIFKKASKVDNSRTPSDDENDDEGESAKPFSIKDLTDADKLLPSILNLSDSDSSDDDEPKISHGKQSETISKNKVTQPSTSGNIPHQDPITHENDCMEFNDGISKPYTDVWNKEENKGDITSAEVARKTFQQLQQKASEMEQTKNTFQKYIIKSEKKQDIDVKDLLAQGEDPITKAKHVMRMSESSESENDDWEEVKERKPVPKTGPIQLVVDFPAAASKKPKPLDLEMMMKRKINKAKKEYQVFMHKVHVLCWIAHGNYVNKILNDQDLMAASLSLLPSQHCYPSDRVDIKYLENISSWFKDKISLKLDKSENKFRPNAPLLKNSLLRQINAGTVSSKKNLVLIFICIMRALGIKCRLMLNFVTLPIKPPISELCSLSTKSTKSSEVTKPQVKSNSKQQTKSKCLEKKLPGSDVKTTKIANIPQLDGNDDSDIEKKPKKSSSRKKQNNAEIDDEVVSPPKRRASSRSKLVVNKNASAKSPSIQKDKKEKVSSPFFESEVSPPKRSRLTTRSSAKNATENDSNSNNKSSSTKKQLVKSETKNNKSKASNESSEYFKKPTQKAPVTKVNDTIEKSKSKIKPIKNTDHNKETTNETKVVRTENRESDKLIPKRTTASSTKPAPSTTCTNSLNARDDDTKKSRTKSAPGMILEKSESKQGEKEDGKRVTRKRTLGSLKRPEQSADTKNISKRNLEVPMENSTSKLRTKSAPGLKLESSKYFDHSTLDKVPVKCSPRTKKDDDNVRVSHRDLMQKVPSQKPKADSDVTKIFKNVVEKNTKDAKTVLSKGRTKCRVNSDEDFKPEKVSNRQRRVLSSEEESDKKRVGLVVWCEVYVEEEEQWISVDVVKGEVHCANKIYSRATHPVCYVVGWDNSNFCKDVTRRYVPHWNTVTRKLRADADWWRQAVRAWLAPPTAAEAREDRQLDNMQRDAPLPTSIAEYKNHPLYALQRHLLKFEVIYPPDSGTLGFVRGEAVYSRYCVHTCRSRDTWLKEARVVRPGEAPYKVVKARPKYDRSSGKMITDIPLEIFGAWQTQQYEPPAAENGLVPRNAYGNVELFKQCMLPKGTVHLQLSGLNKVAKKLNIDCASAMTGFDFHSGHTHPVYDGYVVCAEFEEILRDAWVKDQEDMVRREREKIDNRVYGNWKKLIRGLLIRERLRNKYNFEGLEEEVVGNKKKPKGPRLVVKK